MSIEVIGAEEGVKRLRRPPLHKSWALVCSWAVHWAFWPVLTWVSFALNAALGAPVLVVTVGWLSVLTYLALRSRKVCLLVSSTEIVSVGFFKTVGIPRESVERVVDAQSAPTLAFLVLWPQLTGRSIYFTPGLVQEGSNTIWLDSMFMTPKQCRAFVRRLSAELDSRPDAAGGPAYESVRRVNTKEDAHP